MRTVSRFFDGLSDVPFWRSVVILASGTTLAQMLGLLTTPIVSRLYHPSDFGQYAIILSTSSVILSLVSLGLNSAVMVPQKDQESQEVLSVAFATMFTLSCVVCFVMIVISPFMHFFQSGLDYVLSSVLIFCLVVINGLRGLMMTYINRKGMNRVLFYNALIGAFATLCITIPLGLAGFGGKGLIIASIVAGVIAIAQMMYHGNLVMKMPNSDLFRRVFIKNKDFIRYQYPSNFIGNLSIQIPTQFLSGYFGNINLGAYSMNEKMLGIPSRLIGAPINTIYFRTASQYHREGRNLAQFTYSLVTRIMLLALVPVIITLFWGQQLFSVVLGRQWAEAGGLAGVLIVPYVFMFCSMCTSYCRVAIGKQRVNLLVGSFHLIIVTSSLFLSRYLFSDLRAVISMYAVGISLYLIVDMSVNFYCLGKYCFKYTLFALTYFSIILVLWFLSGTTI